MTPVRSALYLALVAAIAGCSGQKDATQRQLDENRRELVRLRADQATLIERVEALERSGTAATPAESDRAVEVAASPQPPPSNEGPSTPAPPPAKSRGARSNRGAAETPAAARGSFEAASALAQRGACREAVESLTSFLVRYPDHQGVAEAMYLRGHCLLALHERERSAAQLEGLLVRFPGCDRAPDALLDLGEALRELGRPDAAHATFAQLRASYPRTAAAQRAPLD